MAETEQLMLCVPVCKDYCDRCGHKGVHRREPGHCNKPCEDTESGIKSNCCVSLDVNQYEEYEREVRLWADFNVKPLLKSAKPSKIEAVVSDLLESDTHAKWIIKYVQREKTKRVRSQKQTQGGTGSATVAVSMAYLEQQTIRRLLGHGFRICGIFQSVRSG
jgi:hypothetical protein